MKAEISMPKTVSQVTLEVTVTGVRRTKLRIWLGRRLLTFAAFVMGCNINVEMRP